MSKATNFQRFRELTYVQQGVLSAALLERMLPNYALFSESVSFGDAQELRNVLNLVWEKLALPKAKISTERLVEKVEVNTPDLHDFDVFGVFPAIDFCTALLTIIQGVSSKEASDFLDVCKISQASVAKFIEYQLTIDEQVADNKAVREHPLMQFEMDTLSELIDFVAEQGRVSSDSIRALKQFVTQERQTNLGLEY